MTFFSIITDIIYFTASTKENVATPMRLDRCLAHLAWRKERRKLQLGPT